MPRIAGQQVIGLVLVALLGLGLPHRTSAVPVVSAVAELATGSTWVLHYDPQIDAALLETHGSLLDQLPPGTRVVIGLSGDVSSRRYRELLGAERLEIGRAH
ncbi:MAG: hypothetical protein KDB53_14275, partial [Planctomycetes bacterium]|nr:hypothetical protein [Planctomycetota bacterium]